MTVVAAWFHEQGTTRLELQVVTGNVAARTTYTRLGWKEELTQMVLKLDESAKDG